MHRDVKPANIMMDEQHKMIVLVDFGLCTRFSSDKCKTGFARTCSTVGTYRYMAPEVFRKEHYDSKIDVYSGCLVVCSMLFGEHPFGIMPGEAVVKLVVCENLQPDLSSCKNKALAKLLIQGWNKNPFLRPHAHEMEAELLILHENLILRGKQGISSKVQAASSFLSGLVRSISGSNLEILALSREKDRLLTPSAKLATLQRGNSFPSLSS